MKIIYWAGHIGNKFGAYEKYILLMAGVCKNHGNSVIVLHEGENTVPTYRNKLKELGAEYVSIPHTMNEPRKGIPSAIKTIKNYKPDIVHFNFTNPTVLPFAKLLGVPIIYRTSHTGIPRITPRTKISRIMTNVIINRCFVVSKLVRDYEINAGARKEKLVLNYLGLPIEEYLEKNHSTTEEPLPSGWFDTKNKKIISIGRFFPQKGFKFVIEIAIEVLQKYPGVMWWMIGGDGPDYLSCVEMVSRANLENRIIFLKQRNDVPALLKQSYLQVVGSVFEGLPLNVLESSLLEVPTVGPNIRGLDEAIQNYSTGFLIEPRSVESMVSAISLLLENPGLRNWMGENGKKNVNENFNSSYWINQLMNYYVLDYSRASSRNKIN